MINSLQRYGDETRTIDSVLGGGYNLTKVGSGTLTLTANNTYTGVTTVKAGILQIGNGNSITAITNGGYVVNSELVFNNSNTVTYQPNNNLAIINSNLFSGNGIIRKKGVGTVLPNHNATGNFTGQLIIDEGYWRMSDNSHNGDSGKIGHTHPIIINASGTLILATYGGSIGNPISGTGTMTVGFISSYMSPYTLTGNNGTFAGTINIDTAVLKAGSVNAFGTNAKVTLLKNQATIDIAGFNNTIGSLASTATQNGAVVNSSATAAKLTVGNDNSSTTYYGSIQNGNGALSIEKIGTGVLTLANQHSRVLSTQVNGAPNQQYLNDNVGFNGMQITNANIQPAFTLPNLNISSYGGRYYYVDNTASSSTTISTTYTTLGSALTVPAGTRVVFQWNGTTNKWNLVNEANVVLIGHTGATISAVGTLAVNAKHIGGTKYSVQSGGTITASADITLAATGDLLVGTGENGYTIATSILNINSGTAFTVKGGFCGIGGKAGFGSSVPASGIMNIYGTLNLEASGTSALGIDTSALWLSPYIVAPASPQLNIYGTLNTARSIINGAGSLASMPIINIYTGAVIKVTGAVSGNHLFYGRIQNINLYDTLTIDTNGFNVDNGTNSYSIGFAGTGGLIKNGAGTLTINSGTSNYSGTTNINGGTLQISIASWIPTGNVEVNNGGTLTYTVNTAGTRTVAVNAGGVINKGGFAHTGTTFINNGGVINP